MLSRATQIFDYSYPKFNSNGFVTEFWAESKNAPGGRGIFSSSKAVII